MTAVTAGRVTFLPSSVLAVEIVNGWVSSYGYKAVRIWMRGQDKPIELQRWTTSWAHTAYSHWPLTVEDEAKEEQNRADLASMNEKMLDEATAKAEALRDEVARWLEPIEVRA